MVYSRIQARCLPGSASVSWHRSLRRPSLPRVCSWRPRQVRLLSVCACVLGSPCCPVGLRVSPAGGALSVAVALYCALKSGCVTCPPSLPLRIDDACLQAVALSHCAVVSILISKALCWVSLVAQRLTCLPAMRETWVRSLDREDPLERETAPHCSTLAWRIPWTEEPGGLHSMGSLGVGHD